MNILKIGIVGLGTVGEGTLKILLNEAKKISQKASADIEVKYACDLDLDKKFSFDFDRSILIDDYKKIMEDDEIEVVVELIGGETIAKKILLEALENGKSVVTANKALIAKHSKEIFQKTRETNTNVYYEASVGGGIPIIIPLQESLVANNIQSIKGIINGTANYILTEMTQKGLSFDDVLKVAMEKGYAEADPTYDIEGIDTAHKITILASIAYGGCVDFDKVSISGITKIKPEDIQAADELGYIIKLIASAKLAGDKIEVSVMPTLLEKSEQLANVNGVFNAIEVEGDYVGKTLFYGKGAGMDATASAVVADIVKACIKNKYEGDFYYNIEKPIDVVSADDIVSKFYLRVEGADIHLCEEIKDAGIEVEHFIRKDGYIIILTEAVKEKELLSHLEKFEYLSLHIN